MYKAPTRKSFSGLSASEILSKATIITTESNDYIIRLGNTDVELNLTEEGQMAVSNHGTVFCVLNLTDKEHDTLEGLHSEIDLKYQQVTV